MIPSPPAKAAKGAKAAGGSAPSKASPSPDRGIPDRPTLDRQTLDRQTLVFSLLLFAAVLASYSSIIHNQFLDYDDNEYITNNSNVKAGPDVGKRGMGFHHFRGSQLASSNLAVA